MKIVILTGSYFPEFSAVSSCAANLAEEFSKKHEVQILTLSTPFMFADQEEWNGQKINRIPNYRLKTKFKNNGLNRLDRKRNLFFNKVLSKNALDNTIISDFIEGLTSIGPDIDIIIPVSLPYESIIAALKFSKDKEILVMPYVFDSFTENKSLHLLRVNLLLKRKNNLLIEKNVLSKVNKFFTLPHNSSFYENGFGTEFKRKVVIVEHPLIKRPKGISHYVNNPVPVLLYGGSFYKVIREPMYMLKLFEEVSKKMDFIFNIYSFGDFNINIEKASARCEQIKSYKAVSKDKVQEMMTEQVDILIAVGNKETNQIPSKIFEYMSMGKPIIYFYSDEMDSNLSVLSRYPDSCLIYQDYECLADNILEVIEFISVKRIEPIPFETIENTFVEATPHYVYKKMIDCSKK